MHSRFINWPRRSSQASIPQCPVVFQKMWPTLSLWCSNVTQPSDPQCINFWKYPVLRRGLPGFCKPKFLKKSSHTHCCTTKTFSMSLERFRWTRSWLKKRRRKKSLSSLRRRRNRRWSSRWRSSAFKITSHLSSTWISIKMLISLTTNTINTSSSLQTRMNQIKWCRCSL